jgi:hypothetical protein
MEKSLAAKYARASSFDNNFAADRRLGSFS